MIGRRIRLFSSGAVLEVEILSDPKGTDMWTDQTWEFVARIRFLTLSCMILGAFWGLVRMAEANSENHRLVWTAPDAETLAMLANFTCDDDTPERPTPAE